MSQTSSSETPVTKLARFIVDKRKAFFLVFLAAVLFCGSSIDKVVVNNDITSYLPAETETRRGLTLMDEEFTTYASAQVMLSNVTYRQAEKVAAQLAELDGVSSVAFDDSTDHFKDSSALFSVSFTGEEGSPEADAALAAVKELAAPYDHYVFPSGDPYDSDSLMQEMTVILAIAAAVIVAVLLFTSKSYLEVLVFLIVFVVSAILNMGTNFLFDSVSFITNAIAVVLQLALAIDYAIIFCHRYMEERDNGLDAREADIAALSKAIVEISSSSLTTISGLVALMLMQFRIGFDMGIVLSKGFRRCSPCASSAAFTAPTSATMYSPPIPPTQATVRRPVSPWTRSTRPSAIPTPLPYWFPVGTTTARVRCSAGWRPWTT